MLPSIKINGVEKKIEYEGLHLICFKCGKYGHDMEHYNSSCGSLQKIPEHVHGGQQQEPLNGDKSEAAFGGWMVVQ